MIFLYRVYLYFFKRRFVKNYQTYCKKKVGHALLYYKTDSLSVKALAKKYIHTNDWEVLAITKILNQLGYFVDIIDRDITLRNVRKISDQYDIFIGIGAGNSGKYFSDIAERLTKAIKIFYAAGPEPDESNRLELGRYENFKRRHPEIEFEGRRLIDKVDIDRAMRSTDVIFCVGNKFTQDTYKKHGKPIYRINPSSSPLITASLKDLTEKSPLHFLYFGGNGSIVKGLDVLIEAFVGLPELHLYICAPHETEIEAAYGEILRSAKNIHWVGFVTVGGKIFNDLTAKCGYAILPSSSEGIATSVTTVMRKGLVPVTTYESGIDLEDFGFQIKNVDIDALRQQIKEISTITKEDLKRRIFASYLNSFQYTQAGFSKSFETNLISVLTKGK